MSIDLEARRLVRELFRSGLDAEEVLDVVLDELLQNGLLDVQVETVSGVGGSTTIRFKPTRRISTENVAEVVPGSEQEHSMGPISVNGESVEEP